MDSSSASRTGSGGRGALELRDQLEQTATLAGVRPGDARETSLPLLREPQVCDAAVGLGAFPLDQPDVLGAADELRDRALRELEPLDELCHGRALTPVGRALDHQQEQVPLRRQAVLAGDLLARTKERPERAAERGDLD